MLVCLKILVQAFCKINGGINIVLWKSSIEWKGVVVAVVLLGRLETGGVVITHNVGAGGTIEVPISKQEGVQVGIGPQAHLVGIKVLGRAKVEGFLPPSGSIIGSWVTIRGRVVWSVWFPAQVGLLILCPIAIWVGVRAADTIRWQWGDGYMCGTPQHTCLMERKRRRVSTGWWIWGVTLRLPQALEEHCRDRYVSRSVSRLSPYSRAILIMSPPLFRVSYYMLPIPDYAGLFRTIPVSTGNYSSCLNIHLLLSCASFLSYIAVFIRPYSGLHHLSLFFHWAPVGLIGLTGDSLGTNTCSVPHLIYPFSFTSLCLASDSPGNSRTIKRCTL